MWLQHSATVHARSWIVQPDLRKTIGYKRIYTMGISEIQSKNEENTLAYLSQVIGLSGMNIEIIK